MTGYGVDALWRLGPASAIDQINADIRRAYNFIPNQFPTSPDSAVSPQNWYLQLPPDLQRQLLSVALNKLNGICDYANFAIGECNQEGQTSPEEIRSNIWYGAGVLNVSRTEIHQMVNSTGDNWDRLSPEDQWRLIVANGVGA